MREIKRYGNYVVLTDVGEDEQMAEAIKEAMVKLSRKKYKFLQAEGLTEVPMTTAFTVKRIAEKMDPFDDEEMKTPGVMTVAIKYLAYRETEQENRPEQAEEPGAPMPGGAGRHERPENGEGA